MESYRMQHHALPEGDKLWSPENIVQIEQQSLVYLTEKICRDKKCRYPQLSLRILMHVIAGIDAGGCIHICARQLSKEMEVNYDTVTKCLKYLREIQVLRIER